jgi:hypothetical protein
LAARVSPATLATGVLMTSAQGQAVTRTTRDRYSHSRQAAGCAAAPRIAAAAASATTAGV